MKIEKEKRKAVLEESILGPKFKVKKPINCENMQFQSLLSPSLRANLPTIKKDHHIIYSRSKEFESSLSRQFALEWKSALTEDKVIGYPVRHSTRNTQNVHKTSKSLNQKPASLFHDQISPLYQSPFAQKLTLPSLSPRLYALRNAFRQGKKQARSKSLAGVNSDLLHTQNLKRAVHEAIQHYTSSSREASWDGEV